MAEGPSTTDFRLLTNEKFLGNESRWRRFGQPIPAGGSTKPDGTPDYGIFGPGSQMWDVMLHPAVITLESIGQSILQVTYKPIAAGIRDHDPISRKARAGTLTYFDAFERFQRNSGMHAPMWLGDTPTATRMAEHLHRVHKRVASDVIDSGAPELGGYNASGSRDAMWAAITELDSILHIYEAFAFRGNDAPRRLTAEERDRYWAEAASYLRLVGAREEEIPMTVAEVDSLYERYDNLFGHSRTMDLYPETGENFKDLSSKVMLENFHDTQMMAAMALKAQFGDLRLSILGALPERTRRHAGLSEEESRQAVQAAKDALPQAREMQVGKREREIMRLMWGPDGVTLIDSARELHHKVLRERN